MPDLKEWRKKLKEYEGDPSYIKDRLQIFKKNGKFILNYEVQNKNKIKQIMIKIR